MQFLNCLMGGSWLKNDPLLSAELAGVMVRQLTKEKTSSAGCTDMSG